MDNQPSYLQLERDLSQVRHLESLESILNQAGVGKSDIILYGSSIMALCGIRQNNDLEFIPHPEQRHKFKELAEDIPEAYINEQGQIFFPTDVHSSWPNRFIIFGFDDHKLFNEEQHYITHGGYKFLKLELLLSIKGTLRRSKDFEDFSMLEEGDYIGGPEWDWDLVRRVPPWDRPETSGSSNQSVFELGIQSVRNKGIIKTGLRVPPFLASRILNLDAQKTRVSTIAEGIKDDWKIEEDVSQELETHYPAPALLNRQFEDEIFTRDDLIAAVLSIEGKNQFKQYKNELDQDTPSISRDGHINGGILRLATQWAAWENAEFNGIPRLTFPVRVSSEDPLPPRGEQWVADKFKSESVEKISQRRQELLSNAGVYFYAILWPAGIDHHDEIEEWLSQRLDIVSSKEIDLGDDIEDFARAVYSTDQRPFEWEKARKAKKISSDGSTVRVITIRLPDPNFRSWNGPRISDTIYDIKQNCRREFQQRVTEYEYGALIHTTDNYEHNLHIANIVSSYSTNKQR